MKRKIFILKLLFAINLLIAQTPIHQFNFDGNVTNTASTVTLTTNAISYGTDRNGQANKSLYMGLSGSQAWANLTNIPLGNSPRTISIWFKYDTPNSGINVPLYSYGTDTNNNAIIGYFFYNPTDTSVNGRSFGNSFGGSTSGLGYNIPLPFNGSAWHNYAFTYDGIIIKHYFDGNLVSSNPYSLMNTSGNQFNVGNYISNNPISAGWYDDLQIYNVALTDVQMNQIYSNNAVSPVTIPSISSVSSSNITSNSATVNCDFYTNGATTTTALYYGTSSTALNLLAGSSGSTNHSVSVSNRSFSLSGLQPSTTYYYKVNAFNSFGNVDSTIMSFTTSAAVGSLPTISTVGSSNITSNSATVNCSFFTNGSATTTTIYYGTSSTALTLLAGSAGTTSHSASISNRSFALNGLLPNTVYYYKINASNSSGNVDSSVMSFITLAGSGGNTINDGLVAYYGFEGNFNSHNNLHNLIASPNAPITNTASGKVGAGANFVTSNNEGLVNTSSLNTALTGNEFTICYWVQQQTLNSPGADYPSHFEMFGSGFVRNDAGGSDLNVGYGTSASTFKTGFASFLNNYNVWTHIAVVHKANLQEFEIYINGILTSTYLSNSIPIPNLYKFSTNFHIGTGSNALKSFKGNIDEFYIYNRALTSSEIIVVKDNTTAPLSISTFTSNLKFGLYPNPANELVNIDLESEIKLVEIYTLQGQKVLTSVSKQIAISSLSEGIYLVKIVDTNGEIGIQKLIKK